VLYIAITAAALSVSLLMALGADLVFGRDRALTRRLAEIQVIGSDIDGRTRRRERQRRVASVESLLRQVGEAVPKARMSRTRLHDQLVQAGFERPGVTSILLGTQLAGAAGLGVAAGLGAQVLDASSGVTLVAVFYGAGIGWVMPRLYVRLRLHRRQREIRRVLPDALDLLVVCIEAGLGLNQALVRLARDIREASPELARELALANLQIRAGSPREEALRGLAERTGLREIRMLVTTLIQTDRFGTSVARSLRVHARSLRGERRQAAEEAAAKTAIKMVFPLVFCIFPALFVVILGPGLLQMLQAWVQGLG
jgi:tight adherence protein C